MPQEPLVLLLVLDYLGTLAFAVSGALKGIRKGMDIFGVTTLAVVTAIGGGTVRDALLDLRVFWLDDQAYVLLATVAAIAVFLLYRVVQKTETALLYFDAVGRGFTAIGAMKALRPRRGWWGGGHACLTGVGGGDNNATLIGPRYPHRLAGRSLRLGHHRRSPGVLGRPARGRPFGAFDPPCRGHHHCSAGGQYTAEVEPAPARRSTGASRPGGPIMTRPMLALLCLTLLACPVVGQEIIKQWEFNTDGDTEGWLPAHSLAPFVVAGGTLKTRVIGPDPYMHDSAGQAFEITCNDSQYIEVRMRHDDGEGAEFFWADTTEGADAGFVAGKERGFSTEPDGEWHVYHVYPLWSGKVTRLRLDPPGEDGAEVEIDYLRIIQGPISSHDPNSPAWDFGGNNGGWIAVTGGSHLAQTPEGARTTLAAESVNLTGPAVDLQAADYKYAMVHLVAGGPLTAMLYWSATDDGNFPGCNQIIFDVPAGISTLNLRLTDNPMYDGEIKRLRLSLEGDAGTEVTLKQLALVATPQGPASLKVVSFAPTAALAAVGRPAGIVAKVENLGGEPVEGAELSVAVEGDVAALAGPARQTVDGLAPGNVREVTWAVDPLGPGMAALALNVNGGRAATSTLRISEPFETPGPQEKPAAAVERNIAWIGSDKVLLTVVRAGQQFSTALLSAVEDGKTRQMAALPYLAALATPNTEGYVPLTASYARAEDKDGTASLKLGGSATVDEANVTWSVTYSLAPGKQYIEAAYDLGVDRDLRITGFRGPWLWAGEGAFGASQDLGLFPGSEYLVSGERSSSTLDIAPPKHIRFAPHPNTVTVPSMAIEKDGAIVGLMWDPLQRWDREHQKPSAVFASPNFVEGYENHLLGLYLPSIPDWVKANELQAATPYELKSSGRLSLSCGLFAAAKAAVLDSMDTIHRYGVARCRPSPAATRDIAIR